MQNGNYENLILDLSDNVLKITLNRPQAKNAINCALATELAYVLENANLDEDVRVVILTGGEKVFSVGADLKEMQIYANTTLDTKAIKQDFLATWDKISYFSKPIIAAINGYALGGGCEIALMCDIIIAGNNASFAQPEIKVGLIPGAGGTQRLVRSIGKAQAMDICLSGKLITAFEALNMGLISRVSEDENTLSEALELAKNLATYSLGALIEIKKSINQSFNTSLSSEIAQERQRFYKRLHSNDGKEGIQAFIEKRMPKFTHD